MDFRVVHNAENHEYELFDGDKKIGELTYVIGDGVLDLVHTGVRDEYKGQNLGAFLVKEALNDIRVNGQYQIVPSCPYIPVYLRRHPEDQDLVAN